MLLTYLLTASVLLAEGVQGEACSRKAPRTAEERLRQNLFCDYNKNVRPVTNFWNTTIVEFQMYLIRATIKEHSESLFLQSNLLHVWSDAFLTWDPQEYEGIDFLRVSSDDIWVPDITPDPPGAESEASYRMNTVQCHITPGGRVYCLPSSSIHSLCVSDVRYFPYDKQNCTLFFSSFGYVGKFVNITFFDKNYPVSLSNYKTNKEWKLTQIKALRDVKFFTPNDSMSFYPSIKLTFILERHFAFPHVIYIVPGTVLLLLVLSTFCMGDYYLGRITICCFTMLCDITYLGNLYWTLPYVGEVVPLIALFMRDSIVLSGSAILIALLVKHLKTKPGTLPGWLDTCVAMLDKPFIGPLLFGSSNKVEEDTTAILDSPSVSKERPGAYTQVAVLIDRLSFALNFFIFIILYLFFLP